MGAKTPFRDIAKSASLAYADRVAKKATGILKIGIIRSVLSSKKATDGVPMS